MVQGVDMQRTEPCHDNVAEDTALSVYGICLILSGQLHREIEISKCIDSRTVKF